MQSLEVGRQADYSMIKCYDKNAKSIVANGIRSYWRKGAGFRLSQLLDGHLNDFFSPYIRTLGMCWIKSVDSCGIQFQWKGFPTFPFTSDIAHPHRSFYVWSVKKERIRISHSVPDQPPLGCPWWRCWWNKRKVATDGITFSRDKLSSTLRQVLLEWTRHDAHFKTVVIPPRRGDWKDPTDPSSRWLPFRIRARSSWLIQ